MEVQMYSILDRKLRQFGQILLGQSLPGICREIAVGITGSGSMIEKYPGDFDLYHVGSFDAETGEVKPLLATLQYSVVDILKEHDTNGRD